MTSNSDLRRVSMGAAPYTRRPQPKGLRWRREAYAALESTGCERLVA